MAMTINTNVASLNAQRNTANNSLSLSTTMQRLSSGLRINSAKDDAAGLAIADRMNTQVRGMNVAVRNAGDAISMAQVAEGGLSAMNEMLQRMRELAVQASNAPNTTGDIAKLNNEYTELGKELSRMLSATQFNGTQILNGNADFVFQVGANSGTENQITIGSGEISLSGDTAFGAVFGAGTASALDTTGAPSANTTRIAALDDAISAVNDRRASLG
ncbi:hypothetical protein, partial [Melaminivora alkalimesophila]|uniref:flagellin N-terminal helical domain-containing protein n=1 Tax=Melaminivora alkalimesophila TaxID=1165852 RepID=UPI00059306D0